MTLRQLWIGVAWGAALCGATPARLVAQPEQTALGEDVERMVGEGMVEALHSRFHGGRTSEELRLLARAQTNRAVRTQGEPAREEAFKNAEARYLAWLAVVERDSDTDRITRQVNATAARVTYAGMILSQWAVADLDEFEITDGRRGDRQHLLDLLLKTRKLLDQADETLQPLAEELLEADRQRNEEVEEQYLIAGIYDTVPRLQLDIRFNRAWTNLYIGMVDANNLSQRAPALRAAERDFLRLVDSDQSGEMAVRCRLGLAMTLREQGRHEQARHHFDAALQSAEDAALTAQVRYELARGEIEHGRFEEARVVLRPLLEKNPDALGPADQSARFYINLAHLWDANSYLKEAQLLDKTADKSPAEQAIRARADTLREAGLRKMSGLASRGGSWPALVQLFAAETIDPTADEQTRSAAELLFLARQHVDKEDYRQALALLEAATQRANVPPDLSADILFELGVCHCRCGDVRAAAEAFARVAHEYASHPKAAQACTYAYELWARLAEESQRRDDYLRLADVLLNLVRSFPEHERRGEAMWWLPVALQAGGQYEQAGEQFGNVPTDSPWYEEARYRRALCSRLAFEAKRDSLSSGELRSHALAAAGELEEYAEQAEQRADASRNPATIRRWSAAARVGAAEVCALDEVGRFQRALDLLADFEQRYADREQIGRVLATRITAYRRLGQYDQAARVVDQFLQTVPADQAGGTLAVLARGMQEEVDRLEAAGDTQGARRAAEQSIPIFKQLEMWIQGTPTRARHLDAVRYGLARMYYAAGQYDAAREVIGGLLNKDSRDGNVRRLHALVLAAAARQDPTPQRVAEAREAWGALLRDPELRTAAPNRYGEARYNYLELMLREGKAAEVEDAIRQDRIWFPDRAKTKWDAKLNELYERAAAQRD
jgi:tetratricopeptide (TPR) repeat protein